MNLAGSGSSLGSETLSLLLADLGLRTLKYTHIVKYLIPFSYNTTLTAGLAAFLAAVAAFLASLLLVIAAWRAAARASGFWLRLARIASQEAPTTARSCLTVRRERFFWTSSVIPFLLRRR
jgi:hypothetical protein